MQETFKEILKELKNELNKVQSKCKSIAIKDGRSLDYEFYGGKSEAYTKAIEIVEQAAAAEYNNGWIPCSERLPEDNKPVLCWVTSTTVASGETYIIGSCDNGFWFLQTYEIGHHHFPVEDYKVVAWQPLPQPYQPKGEMNV